MFSEEGEVFIVCWNLCFLWGNWGNHKTFRGIKGEPSKVWSLVRSNVSLWVSVTTPCCNYSPSLILLELGSFSGHRFSVCPYTFSFSFFSMEVVSSIETKC